MYINLTSRRKVTLWEHDAPLLPAACCASMASCHLRPTAGQACFQKRVSGGWSLLTHEALRRKKPMSFPGDKPLLTGRVEGAGEELEPQLHDTGPGCHRGQRTISAACHLAVQCRHTMPSHVQRLGCFTHTHGVRTHSQGKDCKWQNQRAVVNHQHPSSAMSHLFQYALSNTVEMITQIPRTQRDVPLL